MPKILIKEKDITSPGTPDSYANFSVLIAGFCGDPSNESGVTTIKPDANGIYEFDSAEAFKNTIGLVAPKLAEDDEILYHYGNQMAYELLNMGYSIIYKPIEKITSYDDAVKELGNDSFWEIFKDKANYDFRFITHGLLESSLLSSDDTEEQKKLEERLKDVNDAIDALNNINQRAKEYLLSPPPNTNFEEAMWLNILYSGSDGFVDEDILDNQGNPIVIEGIRQIYSGFIPTGAEESYASYDKAVEGTNNERTELEAAINSIRAKAVISESDINSANRSIANLAEYLAGSSATGRGDCIALIELDENQYNNTITIKPEEKIISAIDRVSGSLSEGSGKFCAMTVPSVYYNIADYSIIDKKTEGRLFDNNKKFPGAFHYLACFMSSLQKGFREWYAAAGYTRGVSNYSIKHTTVKLGEIAINALEPRNTDGTSSSPKFACNVIANFRGSYYLWGNRTAHKLDDGDLVASHFLNIRQLCCTIKKQLYIACRRFTFDPNSDTLWFNFVNAIKPTLEAMKADQGIRDYKILKVVTDKKATLKAKIRIIPIEAVEDFDLEVSLEDSFGETTAVVNE